ncbi:alpha/beta hydrolase [Halostella sp. JP-L12]|uniref:alpha/beta fold hydrolase n=1 Tax=Halostella TaxID=1843185 RepID=UPI000EF840B5|nr:MULTISPECIES: alpha/beta hydrolase [Halostella]NHN48622.1 alpha/beta hydrolase [Halostella sp. JP-L12]
MSEALARTAWTHEHAAVNGVRLHYVAAGPDEGTPVVLLHGFPEFWYSWRHQIDALADAGYRVVAPDMRGYNVSEKPRGVSAYRVGTLARDVAALVDRVAGGEAHVVGHDWGGVVAWETAIRYPETVASLTAMNAPHPGPFLRELRTLDQAKRSWYTLYFQLPRLPEAGFRAGDFRVLETMFRDGAVRADAFTDEDVRRYKRALGRPGALTAALNYYRALGRGTIRQRVRKAVYGGDGSDVTDATLSPVRVDQPSLVLWGMEDEALSPRLLDGIEEWVPTVRIQRLVDASHWVQNDAPTEVNDHLLSFLDGAAEA